MGPLTREEIYRAQFPSEPQFRWRQIQAALFNADWKDWGDATDLPAGMRTALASKLPWSSFIESTVAESADRETFKAALRLADKQCIETVLMKNRRGEWTVCVSSQVGCAMKCSFCATGRMGLKRNLSADEITDQYRFWVGFLAGKDGGLPAGRQGRISNLVFMGMGEPMANYANVKSALKDLLEYTDLGPTRITVSSVGLLPQLEALIEDREWPPVRLAVSLHSADPATRKRLMPTSYEEFLPRLTDWARRYLSQKGNRRLHLTFEYVLLKDVNDSPRHAELLAKFVKSAGRAKVNLIPYNWTDAGFAGTGEAGTSAFLAVLTEAGVDATRRRSMGADIAAACGQLIWDLNAKRPAGDGGEKPGLTN